MGPKVFQLPILLVLAYVGMGYLSWIVGLLMLGPPAKPLSGKRVVLLPLVASFVMVAWDLAMDPVWANIDHAWVWTNGGAYFGVPLSNFFGWYLTNYMVYQAFAIYLRKQTVMSLPLEYYRLPVLFYGAAAAGNVLLSMQSSAGAVVIDPTGRNWMASDIIATCILISILVMGPFTLVAWARLVD
jgi:putative membrane protein